MNSTRATLRRPRRWTLALVASALLALGSTVDASATEVMIDDPGAVPILPDATVENVLPHAWDHVIVASDGVTLHVFFWMGVEACNGLHSVEVAPTEFGIDVQLMTGTPAGLPGDMMCIALAQMYVTTVTLDEPLITAAE